MGVYKCPICYGTGLVPHGFYSYTPNPTSISTTPKTCRACGGTGIVYDKINNIQYDKNTLRGDDWK